MKDLALFGAIVATAVVCVTAGRAWVWLRSVPSFNHQSYELEPYPEVDPTDEDYERLWAQVNAALDARGDVQ